MGRTRKPWDAVFNAIWLRREPGEVYTPRLSEADFDAVDLDVPLPESYREFGIRFGLGGRFGFDTRLLPFARSEEEVRTRGSRETMVGETAILRKNAAPGLSELHDTLARCVCFGCGWQVARSSFRLYVWDTREVTRPDTEYPVCEVSQTGTVRGMAPVAIERVAESFADFILWLALHRGAADTWAGRISYSPLALRRRHKSGNITIARWLSSNNNAARDLALSIRDRGQTDAFPILADALQEAGCTNADLLDSCRTGDPDIDGVWVLQMLLGKAKN